MGIGLERKGVMNYPGQSHLLRENGSDPVVAAD